MKVTTKINHSAIATIMKAQERALAQTGQEILNDLRNSQTMPFDMGNMQNDQTYVDDSEVDKGKVYIITDVPQARRLYYHPEYNFQTINNPNAGAGWFDPYLEEDKINWMKRVYKELLRRNGGGYVR